MRSLRVVLFSLAYTLNLEPKTENHEARNTNPRNLETWKPDLRNPTPHTRNPKHVTRNLCHDRSTRTAYSEGGGQTNLSRPSHVPPPAQHRHLPAQSFPSYETPRCTIGSRPSPSHAGPCHVLSHVLRQSARMQPHRCTARGTCSSPLLLRNTQQTTSAPPKKINPARSLDPKRETQHQAVGVIPAPPPAAPYIDSETLNPEP